MHVFGVSHHAAELKHVDHPTSPAHPLLRVDRADRRLRTDRDADPSNGNRQHRGTPGAEDYVECSLAYAVEEGSFG